MISIRRVTVLEDRAAVTREGTIAVAGGQQRVVIDGVSPVIADKTLTCTATGARVLDVRCERFVAPWREPGATDDGGPAALHGERHALEAKRADAEARTGAAQIESEALARVAAAALHDLAVAATRGALEGAVAAQLAELDAQDRAARTRLAEAEADTASLAAALERLDARINRLEAEVGRVAARLVIDVVAEAPGEATITAGYVVPCAAWRPYHRAVLSRTPASVVDWQTTACVWQSTGEDWTDCALTFSLERSSLGVSPPDLADDQVHTRRRPDTVTVEAREQELQTTGLGGGAAGAEVPGIDDGGLGLVLVSERATTVRADGAPHRVPVGGFTAPAELGLVAIPLRSSGVHVRARLANAGKVPLLAGPVDLILASGYVGRGEIGFVAPGERIDLGFGPDAEVRAHRSETRARDDAGILGGWNVQTVRVAVRLSNLGAAPRQIVVTERVPVSEVEQVEVVVAPPDEYKLDDANVTQVVARTLDADTGLVTWTVDLPALGRRAVALEYRVRSQRGVAGL